MPTILTGLVDTEDVLADERKIDMSDEIKMLDPDESQFATMLLDLGTKKAIREKVNWLEDELFPRLTALAVSATSAATTITVTTGEGTFLRAGDVIRNALTGEAYGTVSVAGDVATITRSVGDVAAVSSASGAELLIVSNAAQQGATLGTRKITKKVLGFNYAQIVRHPFGFTNTNIEIGRYGESEPMREAHKKLLEHKRSIENLLFWGARDFDTSGTEPKGYVGGAFEYISTWVKDPSGTMTHAELDDFLEDGLQFGSRNKVLFAAPRVCKVISGFLKTAWQPNKVGERKFGAYVDGYISGTFGWEIPVICKRDWGTMSKASSQYGSWAFLIDMDDVILRPLRSTRLLRERQANDADETTHEYLSEFSLEFAQQKHHMIVKNVTA